MNTIRAVSDEQRAKAIHMVTHGYTTREAAGILGLSERTVQRIKEKAKLTNPPVAKPWTEDEHNLVLALLDDGASYNEAAKTVGRTWESVRARFPGRGWTRQQQAEFCSILMAARWRNANRAKLGPRKEETNA